MKRRVIAATHGFTLARRQMFDLDGTHNVEIRVNSGRVWITQEGDLRDHVIGPAETFRPASTGRCLLEALAHAQISLRSQLTS